MSLSLRKVGRCVNIILVLIYVNINFQLEAKLAPCRLMRSIDKIMLTIKSIWGD
jgi:hypothetical protein